MVESLEDELEDDKLEDDELDDEGDEDLDDDALCRFLAEVAVSAGSLVGFFWCFGGW